MRLSYEWLSEFVDLVDVTPQQAAGLLTMSGLEIGEVTIVDLRGILVGRVLSQEPHPKSRNPLWIHQVDLGGRTEQIVAGAPNAGPGSLVPVALPGTTVPNGKLVRDLTIAGVAGRGMMCSQSELLLGDDHSGIMLLETGRPGQDLSELFPLDAILDAEVTSNRPDCLSHFGVARELAALLRRPVKRDYMPAFVAGLDPPGTELVSVEIEAPDLCRRYIGAVVKGVQVGASPLWLRRRLRAAGLRPINNVVDVTNYVLLEYGQPLHAFDLSKLSGAAIRVRRARPGERLVTLDGVDRELTAEMLVVADAERPVGIAGVIGGLDSSVTTATQDVLLEAGNFDGPNVRSTARALGLRTEASSRFEKSLPAELALAGARRAAQLLTEVAGGKVHREWPDVYPRPQEPVRVRLTPEQIDARLGVHVPLEEAEQILRRLDFQVRIQDDGSWDVLAPVFRLDVSIPEDISEEIGRIYGYDKIPATLPGFRRSTWRPSVPGPGRRLDRVREALAGAGYSEAVSTALVPARRLERLGLQERALRVVNALSEDLNALRTSLLPSLLEAASSNRDAGRPQVRLFEIAAAYLSDAAAADQQPAEPLRLGALRLAEPDPQAGRAALLELKGVLERAVQELGVGPLDFRPGSSHLFHPGRCAAVGIGGAELGHLGELHPAVMAEFGLEGRAAACELDLLPLLAAAREPRAAPLPRFPAAVRDLNLVVEEPVLAAALTAALKVAGGPLLERVGAFDEYRGSQVGDGRKSLAFSLTFRSLERTLTDAEVDELLATIKQSLARDFGAGFRA